MKIKARDLRKMSEKDLNTKLKELEFEKMKIYGKMSTGSIPDNPGQLKQIKKNISRIITILNDIKNGGSNKE